MSTWRGKARGGLLGHKIFVFILKKLGLSVAYFALKFVAMYFLFFSPKSYKAMRYYFRERLGYGWLKSIISIYKNFYVFGQVLIDKVALMSGKEDSFGQNHFGGRYLDDMVKNGAGGILISAHIGNFEAGGYLLKRLNTSINVVMLEAEHRQIKKYLSNVMSEKGFNIISIKEDKSHTFEIMSALSNNELICIHADRFLDGMDTMEGNLLGQSAKFPAGPFMMASKLSVPVSFVFVVKESSRHYNLYASKPETEKQDAQSVLNNYLYNLEQMIYKYPEQWFNYYPFWGES